MDKKEETDREEMVRPYDVKGLQFHPEPPQRLRMSFLRVTTFIYNSIDAGPPKNQTKFIAELRLNHFITDFTFSL